MNIISFTTANWRCCGSGLIISLKPQSQVFISLIRKLIFLLSWIMNVFCKIADELIANASYIGTPGKGILAADESTGPIGKSLGDMASAPGSRSKVLLPSHHSSDSKVFIS